jgi:hypothetical protein
VDGQIGQLQTPTKRYVANAVAIMSGCMTNAIAGRVLGNGPPRNGKSLSIKNATANISGCGQQKNVNA